MKIYDITKVASISKIKPEIAHVYVKHTNDGLIYVATDTYRLVEVFIESEEIKGILKEGFYDLKDWKRLSKETQKKNPDEEIILDIEPLDVDWTFPKYEQILPQKTKEVETIFNRVDVNLWIDIVKILEKFTGLPYNRITEKIVESEKGRMIYFEDWKGESKIKTLIMPLNK